MDDYSTDMTEDKEELRLRAAEERAGIVTKYDRGREDGAEIPQWEDPDLEIYHVTDRYGFIHDERQDHEKSRTDQERKIVEKEMTRREKWVNMVLMDERRNNQILYFPLGAKNRGKMIDRVWKGVPLSIRTTFWTIMLDIETFKVQNKHTYQQMKDLARKYSPDIRQIDLDVNRTYRNTTYFRERYNTKQQDLFHVLAAYSMYNTEVGYCQGMSQIAALLLIFLNTEEDAFWGLHMLMVGEKYKMHGLFIPQFPKLVRFQEHFDKILRKKLYRLYKHLVKNEVSSNIYTIKWFFLCFLDRLPFSLSLRVWDLYLLEGEQIMFAMGYTILKMHQRELLRKGMDELLEYIQVSLGLSFGYDDDKVIESLRNNLDELKKSGLHSAGPSPQVELPEKPFGTPNVPTAEEEAGYRQPFSEKERHFSLQAIQRETETVQRLSRFVSQTSLEEGSNDQSLNDTASGGEPEDTRERHSDPERERHSDPDISIEANALDRSQTNTSSDVSLHIQTPAPPEQFRNSEPSSPRESPLPRTVVTTLRTSESPPPHYTEIYPPPSPLPPSQEQDELDKTVISMLEQCGSIDRVVSKQDRGASTSLHKLTSSGGGSRMYDQYARPASADPRAGGLDVYHAHQQRALTNNKPAVRLSDADVNRRGGDVSPSLAVMSSSYSSHVEADRSDPGHKRHSAHVALPTTSHILHPKQETFVDPRKSATSSRDNINNSTQSKPSRIPLSSSSNHSSHNRQETSPSRSTFRQRESSPGYMLPRDSSPVHYRRESSPVYHRKESSPVYHRKESSPPLSPGNPMYRSQTTSPSPKRSPVRSSTNTASSSRASAGSSSRTPGGSRTPVDSRTVSDSRSSANHSGLVQYPGPSQVQNNKTYSASKQLSAQEITSARKSSIGSAGSRIPVSDVMRSSPKPEYVTSPTSSGPSVGNNGSSSRQPLSPPFSPTSRIPVLNSSGAGVTSPTGRAQPKSYFFGENPMVNGIDENTINAQMEGVTPHKGEVLRIRVGSERADRGPSIHREDKEISPRIHDHKVTIKVNQSEPDLPVSTNQSNSVRHTKHVTTSTKKFVSSSSKKIGADGHIHQTSSSQMYEQHTDSAKGKNDYSSMYSETRRLDGNLVSQVQEYNHNTAAGMPQVQTSPDFIKSNDSKMPRSGGRRAGDITYNTETLF